MTISTDPFAAAFAEAQTREAMQATLAEQRRLAEAEQAKLTAEASEAARLARIAQKHVDDLKFFGKNFLGAVAKTAIQKKWSTTFILIVKDFAEGLLCKTDKDLPKLDPATRNLVLDKFENGLRLAADHGVVIEDGFFFGQRLLAERAAEQGDVKVPRLRIVPGDKPTGPSQAKAATVTDLPSAITPSPKKVTSRSKTVKAS